MKGRLSVAWGVALLVIALGLLVRDGLAQGRGGRQAEESPEPGFLPHDFALPELNGRQVRLSRAIESLLEGGARR